MNTENMIEVTEASLTEMAKAAYELSVPRGLGFIHARDGGLSDEDAANCVDESNERFPLKMDYVHGRSCKFRVSQDDEGRRWIRGQWYDHTPDHLQELLSRVLPNRTQEKEA